MQANSQREPDDRRESSRRSLESPTGGQESDERLRAEAFVAFHARNHTRIAAFIHTLVPSWEDAEEIVQDTMLVLWRKFDQFDPTTSFFSWAARVAQYEVLNYRRSKKKQVRVLDDEVLEAIAQTALRQLDDIELHREALEHCIKKLPARDREIIALRYQEESTVEAVANAVQRTAGHVQRLLRKIRAGLIRCIHIRLSEHGI